MKKDGREDGRDFDCSTLWGRLKLFFYDVKNYGISVAIDNWRFINRCK